MASIVEKIDRLNKETGYVVKNFRSNHSYKERILMLEEFVYMLSLEEVRKVAELLKVLDF